MKRENEMATMQIMFGNTETTATDVMVTFDNGQQVRYFVRGEGGYLMGQSRNSPLYPVWQVFGPPRRGDRAQQAKYASPGKSLLRSVRASIRAAGEKPELGDNWPI